MSLLSKPIVLITGGTGLLGINLSACIFNEYDVYLGVNNRNVKVPFANTVNLSFNNFDSLYKEIKGILPNIIINTSGITNVELCEIDIEKAFNVNAYLAGNLARISASINSKFIHISTDHLFNGDFSFKSEISFPDPLNIYGKSKLEGEKLVRLYNKNALILRTNFFGWGTNYRKSFSDFIIENLRNHRPISLFNDVFYTPILIQSLVSVIRILIFNNKFGIYNIVSSEKISKYDFGILVARVFNLNEKLINQISFFDKSNLIKRPLDMSLSNEKLKNDLENFTILSIQDQVIFLRDLEFNPNIQLIKNL
jgi:dTDP-4-dehydrorhamnose reductase